MLCGYETRLAEKPWSAIVPSVFPPIFAVVAPVSAFVSETAEDSRPTIFPPIFAVVSSILAFVFAVVSTV
jgi:hypothetical protein